jgi:hypothetical protein
MRRFGSAGRDDNKHGDPQRKKCDRLSAETGCHFPFQTSLASSLCGKTESKSL